MKRRTYQVLEIWKNYGTDTQEFLTRTESLHQANDIANSAYRLSKKGDKIYILNVEVMIKMENDGEAFL